MIGVAGPPYLPAASDNITDALAEIDRKFRDAAGPIKTVEWRGRPVWAGILVPQKVRAADLLVVGPDPDQHDLSYSHHPGAIILRAGRPAGRTLPPSAFSVAESWPLERAPADKGLIETMVEAGTLYVLKM